ncbi:MAG: class I SAM-dependent methyltransferase [Verrucomicrobiota bacterium]|nr:class I SAM-dependent methyltransferase [Verrucomicrobiota bacterium]
MSTVVENESAYASTATAEAITRVASPAREPASSATPDVRESLFERFAWAYILFREKLFRDDTNRFVRALWPDGAPQVGERLIELGCGPGFYSCALAARFPELSVVGIDRSESQLQWARAKARDAALPNCHFKADNVLKLSHPDDSYDAIVAARLFTVLSDRERGIAEMHRVLRSGGQCVIAEPRYAVWASLPLFAMWCIASVTGINSGFSEPSHATVLKRPAFEALFATQPWASVRIWRDGRYQYALCEKR